MDSAETVTDRVSTLECSHCHTQQPREGFRGGVCGKCGPDTLPAVPESVLRQALWFALGGRGVRKATKQRICRILSHGQ